MGSSPGGQTGGLEKKSRFVERIKMNANEKKLPGQSETQSVLCSFDLHERMPI